MSFGFSTGNFATAIYLVIRVQTDFVDAPGEFKAILDKVRVLSIVLQNAAVAFSNREFNDEQKKGLEAIDKGCRSVLDELQQILENHTELIPESGDASKTNKIVWKGLNWNLEDIDQLLNRIDININLLNNVFIRDNVVELVRHQEDQGRQTSDFIRQRAVGTGKWLLDSTKFQTWVNTNQLVLFCPGIPRAGKTILTSIVVNYLYANFQKDTNIGIAYLYCNFRRFLLAQLFFDSLKGKTSVKAIRSALKRLLVGSDAYDFVYNEAMERIEGQGYDTVDLANRVLSWITYAKRPLTTSELQYALAVEIGISQLGEENVCEVEDTVSLCGATLGRSLSENLELTRGVISSGADLNSEDSNGVTPLQMAVRLKEPNLVELLLQKHASMNGIMVDEWRSLYGQPSVTVKLVDVPGGKKYLELIQDAELQGELTKTPSGHETQRRLFLFTDDSPWEKEWIADTKTNASLQRNKLNIDINYPADNKTCTYSVAIWFSVAQSQVFKRPIDEKLRITWTMVWLDNSNGEPLCRSTNHFSTLQYAWIPEYSLQFFACLIRRLKEEWLEVCYLGQNHITQCRRDVYSGKGEESGLINHLLEDAQQWTDFRSDFRGQVDAARKLGVEYSPRFHEEVGLRELQSTIDDFERQINGEIDLLHKSSQSLIEMEFNLVSINEARRSTTMSASMKRLSWVTFIFLPAMFASSLFGMNVSLLKDNPDWRWYLLFGGAFQVLTLTAWLSFKYIPIETWIESKAYNVQRKLAGTIPRADVENGGKLKRICHTSEEPKSTTITDVQTDTERHVAAPPNGTSRSEFFAFKLVRKPDFALTSTYRSSSHPTIHIVPKRSTHVRRHLGCGA
ncbi:hypothetical protein V499_01625 [Pseudogymnoascus sp. VKM F-103]|nr:hypothetical protein V499_01625 [Pseudogymnoascus sp. VKM F-103]